MSLSDACPCGSNQSLEQCCGRYHAGQHAPDAEQLMRSRYSAYVLGRIDYLQATTLPVQQAGLDLAAMQQWSRHSHWLGLEVESVQTCADSSSHARVTFTARWQDARGSHSHHECSAFVLAGGRWFFINPGQPLNARRNDPCPCGSTRKFKKCCAPWSGRS